MFKMCPTCGKMYDERGAGCPDCNPEQSISPDSPFVAKKQETVISPAPAGSEAPVIINKPEQEEVAPPSEQGFDYGPVASSGSSSVEKTKVRAERKDISAKKFKKIAIIGLSVMLGLLVILTIVAAVIKSSPVKIDLEYYINQNILFVADEDEYDDYSYDYDDDYDDEYSAWYESYEDSGAAVMGYNGYAVIEKEDSIIHWDSLADAVNEELRRKGASSYFEDYLTRENFKITYSKEKDIANDDEITVTVEFIAPESSDVEFEFTGATHTFTVSGLEEAYFFDPFPYVSVSFSGVNGEGSADVAVIDNIDKAIPEIKGFYAVEYSESRLDVERDGSDQAKIYFEVDYGELESGTLKNGDVITVKCSVTKTSYADYNIGVSTYEKEYTVAGLGSYATNETKFTAADINAFKTHSAKKVSGSSTYVGTYFAENYDSDSSNPNEIFVIYHYQSYYSDKYYGVYYDDIIVDAKGNVQGEPKDYYGSYSSYYEDSVSEVLEYRYEDDYSTKKIG